MFEEDNVRGLCILKFIDRHNQKCSLQESSLAIEDCIWLGVDSDRNGRDVHKRMHLTVGMVKELIPMLQRFVDTGCIKEYDEP